MIEVKHTPGPWTVDQNHKWTGYGDVDAVIMAGDQIVSTIYGGRELQPQIKALPTFESCRANAALIAAAPDMLAALRSIQEWLLFPAELTKPDANMWNSEFVKANNLTLSAIAKATGAA